MKNEFYIDEVHEKELGIRFVDDAAAVNPPVRHLQRKLDDAAVRLGVEAKEVVPPPRGFLAEPLTETQRKFINLRLMLRISGRNVLQQENLKNVPIEEQGERMASLQDILGARKIDMQYSKNRFHMACGKSAGKERIWHMRESAAHNLARLFSVLNTLGIRPHVEDCYRPPEVQQGLLLRRIVQVAQEYPDWTPYEVFLASRSFTASVPGLAGHQAGAAIDVRFISMREEALFGVRKDALFDLGNMYPEGSAIACIDNPYITAGQFVARMQFAHLMRMAGFKVLDTENWHASHGDRGLSFDTHAPAMKAIYGPIVYFDRETGEIEPWERRTMDYSYLSDDEAAELTELSRKKTGRPDVPLHDPLFVINTFRHRKYEREHQGLTPEPL